MKHSKINEMCKEEENILKPRSKSLPKQMIRVKKIKDFNVLALNQYKISN